MDNNLLLGLHLDFYVQLNDIMQVFITDSRSDNLIHAVYRLC